MTLRHKETHEEFEPIAKFSDQWSVFDAHGERRMFKQDVLQEIAPAPKTWRDVTAECEFIVSGPFNYIGFRQKGFIVSADTGYRLRKIQVAPLESASSPSVGNWAFLVEKGTP